SRSFNGNEDFVRFYNGSRPVDDLQEAGRIERSNLDSEHFLNVGPTGRIAAVHRFAARLLPAGPPTSSCLACRAVLFETLVHERDDLIQRLGLQSLLSRDPPHKAIDALDIRRAAKQRAGSR